jgi:hypothetical protein
VFLVLAEVVLLVCRSISMVWQQQRSDATTETTLSLRQYYLLSVACSNCFRSVTNSAIVQPLSQGRLKRAQGRCRRCLGSD